MSVFRYGNNVLESKARYLISRYDPYLLDDPAPIPVEDMIEYIFGLYIQYHYIRNNGRILGETVFEDSVIPIYDREGGQGYKLIFVKAGTVIIDASLLNCRNDGRLRYTFAHELAHWVLHKELFTQLGETAAMTKVKRSSEVGRSIERQADALSSYLLMPKGTVKKAFHRCNKPLIEKTTELAKLFLVSTQTMGIRLKEMGLVY